MVARCGKTRNSKAFWKDRELSSEGPALPQRDVEDESRKHEETVIVSEGKLYMRENAHGLKRGESMRSDEVSFKVSAQEMWESNSDD